MTTTHVEFNFEVARLDFKEKICKDLSSGNVDNITSFIDLYTKYVGTETEKKTAADQTLRDLIREELSSVSTIITNVLDVVTISVSVARRGLCSPSIPFIILGDVLDCSTLDECDIVFHYIEERVGIWKSTVFYTAGKNYLLRMCNDLLRRLSQSKNTVFCGRIQLFLARLFPLSEKSALNLVSQFNLENVTIFNDNPQNSTLTISTQNKDVDVEKMEVVEQTLQSNIESSIPSGIVDFQLYQNIWELQDLFRYPVQCYTKELWDKFTQNADSVFSVFSSFKLEDVVHSRGSSQLSTTVNRVYFSKFLTSDKLTDLQLSDGLFRRQILTQFLVLFQYLTSVVKFKGASLVLTDAMKIWISETEPKIYNLLKETPPNGKRFASYIKHLMQREEFWITWKNEGCPSFMKTAKNEEDQAPVFKKRKLNKQVSIADDFIAGKNLGLGSPELTRLWNLSPDNFAACQSQSREFIPSLQDYFINCIEENDPKNEIEDQYKSIYKSNFQWKALRLLSHRSQLFFTSQPTNMQFKTVPDYLATVIAKIAKDFSTQPQENGIKSDVEEIEQNDNLKESPATEENKDTEGDDVLNHEDDTNEDDEIEDDGNLLEEPQDDSQDSDNILDQLTTEDVTSFASKIGSGWKKLASFLNIKANMIKQIEEDSDDFVIQARQTLVTWQDEIGKDATLTILNEALKKSGLEKIVKG